MLRRFAGLLASVSTVAIAAPVVDRSSPSPVTNVSREQLENMPTARNVADLIRTCPAQTIPTVTRPTQGGQTGAGAPHINCVQPDDLKMIDIYKLHNEARAMVGSPPLVWDPLLAAQAGSYGPSLAQSGRPVHSSRVGRETSRENLLQALPGTSPKAMVGVWTAEAKYFRNGIFPDVSSTGNWADVGHYSQMIWPSSTNLGCAVYLGGQFDWLICRYSPPGNKDGKMVLAERDKEAPLPPTTGGGILHPSGIPQPQKVASDPCSPAAMAAADVRIPWNRDGTKPAGDPAPPPESILDDVGDTQTRATPAPLPKMEKGKAVHGTPMAQPRGPTEPPPESILDDVDQCKPPPRAPKAGIVGQPTISMTPARDLPGELSHRLDNHEATLRYTEQKCDAAWYEDRLIAIDEVRRWARKVAATARQVGKLSDVDVNSLDSIAERADKLIEKGNDTLADLKKKNACPKP